MFYVFFAFHVEFTTELRFVFLKMKIKNFPTKKRLFITVLEAERYIFELR